MGAREHGISSGMRGWMPVYSALLGFGLLASAPWWVARMAMARGRREGFGERLGMVPARLRAWVQGKRVVWVHAVSVGEVLAVSRLVNELEAALEQAAFKEAASGQLSPEHGQPLVAEVWTVVVSTTTQTGQALARERFGAHRVFYFPLDFGFAVRAYLRTLRPGLLVLAESELWPRLLYECALRDVPTAVVNARVSDRSFRRAQGVHGLWSRMLRTVSLFLAQSDEDARRLTVLGSPAGGVVVSGNLKYDVRAPKNSLLPELIQEVAKGRPVLVAGSTVAGRRGTEISEDALLLRAWENTLRDQGVLLVLAPRHSENFASAASMAGAFPMLRATEMLGLSGEAHMDSSRLGERERRPGEREIRPGEQQGRPVEIIVVDTIGDLAAVYRVADVAFVGGSLVHSGGHNPLEPAQFGVPVVMGPSVENFRQIVHTMKSADGICLASEEQELGRILQSLFRAPAVAQAIGQRGKQVFEGQSGATARSLTALMELLAPRTGSDRPPDRFPDGVPDRSSGLASGTRQAVVA